VARRVGRHHSGWLDQDAALHRRVAAHRPDRRARLMVAIYWVFRFATPARVDHWFRKLQLVSAALFSLNHGANDAQKNMGISRRRALHGAGVSGRRRGRDGGMFIPFWIVLAAHARLASARCGRLAHHPHDGVADYQAAASPRFAAETGPRRPSSSRPCWAFRQHHARDHGSIVGVRRRQASLGGTVGGRGPDRVWAWILTIPGAAIIGCRPTSSRSVRAR